MIDLAFFGSRERTEFSDELYAVIGRALSVATHYEANCRSLATVLEVRQQLDPFSKKEELEETIERLYRRTLHNNIKLLKSLNKKVSKYHNKHDAEIAEANEDLADYLFKKLDKAREARNIIAHEITLGIEHKAEDEGYKREIIEMIQEQIKFIAEADFHIARLIEYFNKTNVAPSLDKYVESIVQWVCEVEY